MTQNEREIISRKTYIHYLFQRFFRSFSVIKATPAKVLFIVVYLFIVMLVGLQIHQSYYEASLTDSFFAFLEKAAFVCHGLFALGGLFVVLVAIGTPRGSRRTYEALWSAGLTNHGGDAPLLLSKCKDTHAPRVTVWEFAPNKIPLEVWQTKQTTIEGALDITIAKMVWAKGRKVIRVYAVPAAGDLPSLLPWQDKYLSKRNFELVLGEGITGPVTVNLAYVPHVLLGGSTGSGKSVLLKLLLMQALRKGAKVYIADFKGGVDFRAIWHQKCRMCFEEHDLLDMLTELVDKLEQRKKSFQVFGAANIDEYNEAEGTDLPRYVFACDEVAEMLDKTGLTKEQKELVSQIEGKLSTIARQGRAFGIHLILATQRPDATIIPGQIKNNIDFRVCGRADNVLSQIILDSTAAADQIPKDARGRFITRDGTVFQAFLFDEGEL